MCSGCVFVCVMGVCGVYVGCACLCLWCGVCVVGVCDVVYVYVCVLFVCVVCVWGGCACGLCV